MEEKGVEVKRCYIDIEHVYGIPKTEMEERNIGSNVGRKIS